MFTAQVYYDSTRPSVILLLSMDISCTLYVQRRPYFMLQLFFFDITCSTDSERSQIPRTVILSLLSIIANLKPSKILADITIAH